MAAMAGNAAQAPLAPSAPLSGSRDNSAIAIVSACARVTAPTMLSLARHGTTKLA